MRLRTLFLLMFVALIAVFVAVNWSAFVEPTMLTLGVGTVEAPLGLVLLGLAVVIIVTLLAYAAHLQRAMLTAAARHSERLEAQRNLAERAEISRYTQLREFVEEEFRKSADRDARQQADLGRRLDELEVAVRTEAAPRDFDAEHHQSLMERGS